MQSYNLKTLKEIRLSLDILQYMIGKMIDEEERRIIEKHCKKDEKSEE